MRRDDVNFYADLARKARGAVLELGCGTGRVLVPCAAAGAMITGLDLSDLMIEACRRKLEAQPAEVQTRATLVVGDMTAFELNADFALVILPFRGIQHLIDVDSQLACLRNAHRHLAHDGRLALDVFRPRMEFIVDPGRIQEQEDCPESPLPDGRTVRRTARTTEVHTAEQWFQVEFNYYITDAAGKTERLSESFPMRYYFRYELEHLLGRTGFDIERLYGNFDGSPFGDESQEMIVVAKKAG